MIDSHCDDDDLSMHLLRPNANVERHVDGCSDCRDRLELFREIDRALSLPVVWQTADRLRERSPIRESLMNAARSIDAEDADAETFLATALISIGSFEKFSVATSRRHHSAGMARVLTREARARRDSMPKFALLLASTATSVAASLGDRVTPAVVGAASLERGILEFLLGEYRNCEITLRSAEESFRRAGETSRWDMANVWLTRANLYVETDRLDEALDLAARAGDIFLREYGDVQRYLSAALVRGTVLYVRRAYEESLEVFHAMLSRAEESRDRRTCARALHNAANCYLATSDFARAGAYYLRALALWDELGSDAEAARTRWSLATIDVMRGEWKLGYEGLEDARRQLNALGLLNDEALVRIEMAEVLILLRRYREVAPLLAGIVLHFTSEGMMRNARLALASITEAARAPLPTAAELRHVREYLRSLPTSPSEPFRPLR